MILKIMDHLHFWQQQQQMNKGNSLISCFFLKCQAVNRFNKIAEIYFVHTKELALGQ